MHPYRLAAIAAVALSLLAPVASAKTAPRFSFPQKAVQGQLLSVQVVVKKGARCTLSVRYADTHVDSAAPAVARTGRIAWRWRVAPTAALGQARATVACGRAGASSSAFIVVGPDVPANVVVEKQGFAQRPDFGGRSTLSYGIMLANRSPQQDAVDTYVLVNFVDSSDNLVGTQSTIVKSITAGATYALGQTMSLRTQIPVARLEIRIQMRQSKPHAAAPAPDLQAVRIIPSQTEPAWVGEVDGEVVNGHDRLTLQRSSLSIVLMDAAGQIVGGGTGQQFGDIPPNTRAVFVTSTGFRAVPSSRAVTAVISVTPTYVLS